MVKNILIIISLIFICSCGVENTTEETKVPKDEIFESLGIEDYESIIRHPVEINTPLDSLSLAKISFAENTFDFDTIKQGEILEKQFVFQNTGTKALYILDTKVSCGCTVVSVDENAIEPGMTGRVIVRFDSRLKSGVQDRTIILITNSIPNEVVLKLKGYIKV